MFWQCLLLFTRDASSATARVPCCSVCFAACTVAEHRYRCKFVANYAMEYLASQIMMVPCSAGLARRRTAHALSKARLSRGTRCLPSAQIHTPHAIRPPDSPQGGLTAKRRPYLFGLSRFAPAKPKSLAVSLRQNTRGPVLGVLFLPPRRVAGLRGAWRL